MDDATSQTFRKLQADEIKNPVFAGVEEQVVRALLAAGEARVYPPGATVLAEYEEGSRFFILHTGSVKVFYRSPEGLQVVVKLFRAPAVFGEMECLAGIGYLESVQALEKSIIVAVPRAVLLQALEASHALALNLLKDVAARLCIAAQNERALTFHPVETRLANLLLTYIDFYGLPAPTGIMIRIPLTQNELADSLGVVRRSIARTLRRWNDEGVVVKEGGRFVVRDPTRLAAVSDPDLLRIGHRTGVPLRPAKRP